MKLELLKMLLLLGVMLVLIGLASWLPPILFRRKHEKMQSVVSEEKARNIQASTEIVSSIPTNNTYPQLEKTFTDLLENLAVQQLNLNIDLEGYTTDGNQQGI